MRANRDGRLKEVGRQQSSLIEGEMEPGWVKRDLAELKITGYRRHGSRWPSVQFCEQKGLSGK